MAWIVCGVFSGGVLFGVVLTAMLVASREPANLAPVAEGVRSSSAPAICRGVWHLTPRGWEPGVSAAKMAEPACKLPADRVMSCCYLEQGPSLARSAAERGAEFWRCEESGVVGELLDRFGECPPELVDLPLSSRYASVSTAH